MLAQTKTAQAINSSWAILPSVCLSVPWAQPRDDRSRRGSARDSV
jgi:hypothetical protein